MAAIIETTVGHGKVKQKLIKSYSLKRLAPTLLFAGPHGVGKKQVALGLAQVILCAQELACGECPSCLKVSKQQSEDLLLLKPEGQQYKVDQARDMIQFLSLQSWGKNRVVILDEVEKMNPQTANALLKTLEDPPENSSIILVTSNASALLATLRSRSQFIHFGPLSFSELQSINPQPEWKLKAAQGSLSRLADFEDAAVDELKSLALSTIDSLNTGSTSKIWPQLKELAKERPQLQVYVSFLQQLLRDSCWVAVQAGAEKILHPDALDVTSKLAENHFTVLDQLWRWAYQLELDIKGHLDRSLSLENYLYQAEYAIRGRNELLA